MDSSLIFHIPWEIKIKKKTKFEMKKMNQNAFIQLNQILSLNSGDMEVIKNEATQ